MVLVNIIPVGTSPYYTVDDEGVIHITLKETLHSYSDGSNPQHEFTVTVVEQTLQGLKNALSLAMDDAIDYFKKEIDAIEYRELVLSGMAAITIDNPLFSADTDTYEKTQKVSDGNGEIIISDTIKITEQTDPVYLVSAYVMDAGETRDDAIGITVLWNSNTGHSKLKEGLISKFREIKDSSSTLLEDIKSSIGVTLPKTISSGNGETE
ncbi:hypothetical protein [Methanosarcina acetivorans]|nr:hypothetical protein [Methanosarcina acetivorans]